jgi:glucose-6-phosphate dehydrogenase assembly protein OpcA
VTRTEEIVTNWSGKHVDADRIEAELALLRYEAAGKPEQGQGFALRTSYITLVVYANDMETAKRASRTIASLSSQHPSRGIIIVARPDAADHGIDTELSAHCHLAPGLEQQVCCEEVTLTVNGPAAQHLHSVIAPLVIPELPVYLWWIGALPHDHHLISELMAQADRFIVDSGRFTDPKHDLHQLDHLASRAARCALGDLNWQRLQPWRQAIQRHCTAPSLSGLRENAVSIDISYASHDGLQRPSQALLMAGCLADYLRLEYADAEVLEPGHIRLHDGSREALVRIAATDYPTIAAGELVSVRIACRADRVSASLEIARTTDPLLVRVTVEEQQGMLEDHLRIGPSDEESMLALELDSLTHDPEYQQVLSRTLPLVAAIG